MHLSIPNFLAALRTKPMWSFTSRNFISLGTKGNSMFFLGINTAAKK